MGKKTKLEIAKQSLLLFAKTLREKGGIDVALLYIIPWPGSGYRFLGEIVVDEELLAYNLKRIDKCTTLGTPLYTSLASIVEKHQDENFILVYIGDGKSTESSARARAGKEKLAAILDRRRQKITGILVDRSIPVHIYSFFQQLSDIPPLLILPIDVLGEEDLAKKIRKWASLLLGERIPA